MLNDVVNEIKKEGLTINTKMEYIVVSERGSPRWELYIGDIKMKQLQKVRYMGSVVTANRKCETEIQNHIMVKDAF